MAMNRPIRGNRRPEQEPRFTGNHRPWLDYCRDRTGPPKNTCEYCGKAFDVPPQIGSWGFVESNVDGRILRYFHADCAETEDDGEGWEEVR